MTPRLIKGEHLSEHNLVQNFGPTNSAVLNEELAVSPRLSEEAREILELRDEISELKRIADEAQSENAANIERVRADTREQCQAEFREDEDARIEILKAGVAEARVSLEEKFSGVEKLSLAISEAALEGIFGLEHMFGSHLEKIVSAQLQNMRRESVLEVLVSPLDFADESALNELAAGPGCGQVTIRADADIVSGSIRIKLRLGHVEISLPESWKELQAVLTKLSEERI